MPTRYLKQGICDSDSINAASPLAECLYYRLLVNVDDFGRLDARPAVVKARCFPIKESVLHTDVRKCLHELCTCNLIQIYECDGREYLQILKWDNKPRASESKFPKPPPVGVPAILHTNAKQLHTNVPLTVTETVNINRNRNRKPDAQKTALDDDFDVFWQAYPNKTGKGAALKAWVKAKAVLQDVLDALRWQVCSEQWTKDGGQFIPNPATYLNQQRWQDAPGKIKRKLSAVEQIMGGGNGNDIKTISTDEFRTIEGGGASLLKALASVREPDVSQMERPQHAGRMR